MFDTTTERVRFTLALLQNFTIRIVGILLRITDLCELRLTSVDSDFLPFMQSDDTPNSRHSSFIDFFKKKNIYTFLCYCIDRVSQNPPLSTVPSETKFPLTATQCNTMSSSQTELSSHAVCARKMMALPTTDNDNPCCRFITRSVR